MNFKYGLEKTYEKNTILILQWEDINDCCDVAGCNSQSLVRLSSSPGLFVQSCLYICSKHLKTALKEKHIYGFATEKKIDRIIRCLWQH